MIEFATNIPATRWATVAFQVIADFTNPSPTFSIVPLESHTRGAVFDNLAQPIPGVLIVTYRFNFPLQVNERIDLTTFHVIQIGTLAPFVPVSLIQIPLPGPGDDEIIQFVVVATDPPPAQFSPPTICEIHGMVERVIPGLVAPMPP